MRTVNAGFALALVLLMCIGGIIWISRPQPAPPKKINLPPGAVMLPGTMRMSPLLPHPWLNDHELLLGQQALDIRTGARRTLPGIARLFQLPGLFHGQEWPDPQAFSLSPDKKWLLWPGLVPAHGAALKLVPFQPVWCAGRLDGSRLIVRPRPLNAERVTENGRIVVRTRLDNEDRATVAWEPNGKAWVEVEDNYSTPDDQAHLVVYRLDSPQEQDLPVNWQALNSTLSFASNGDGLLFSLGGGAAPVMLYRFRLTPSPILLSSVNYALNASYANGCALAPSGTAVAWLLYKARSPRRDNAIEKAAAFLERARAQYTRSVWVSRLDGSDLHQIVPDNPLGSPGWSMSGLQWTADGRRLCLFYNDAFWTFPAAG